MHLTGWAAVYYWTTNIYSSGSGLISVLAVVGILECVS